MSLGGSIGELLLGLEESLLDPVVRRCADRVGELLHRDFVEIGCLGEVFGRAEVIESLGRESAADRALDGFGARMIGEGVALVTYRVRRTDLGGGVVVSMRSSIWRLEEGAWKMVFHQGTLVGAGEG